MAHSKAYLFDDPHDFNQNIATYSGALKYTARIMILRWLAKEGPKHPKEISQYIGLSMSTTSHHLAVMERAGLIQGFEEGRHIIYHFNRANFPIMREFFQALFDDLAKSAVERSE